MTSLPNPQDVPSRSTLDSIVQRCGRLLASRRLFTFWERLGIHITPVHFYQPIPDSRSLSAHRWGRREIPAIRIDEQSMLALLDHFLERGWLPEFARVINANSVTTFPMPNGLFEAVDADILYAQIRMLRPRRIIEVGCGYSSLVIDMALEANGREDPDYRCDHVMDDPFPSPLLNELKWKQSKVLRQRVQDYDLSEVRSLESNDILFIDSSHVLATGSDVEHEFRLLVPSVAPGVVVHVHDIFTPYDYPQEWVLSQGLFWTEQYALENFLAFNIEFEVVWAGNCMKKHHAERLAAAIPHSGSDRVVPGSCWLRRKPRGAAES